MNQNNEQMIFDLRRPSKNGLENFFITGSNEVAVGAIKKWKTWPEKKLILLGESGSGKSHLVDFWAKESHGRSIKVVDLCGYDVIDLSQNEALIIENIDDITTYGPTKKQRIEEELFHLINAVAQASCYLLITSSSSVSSWDVQLPDLLSRLMSITIVEILPPDDQLLMAILLKQFDDRQITISPEFITFVSKRINRTYDSICKFVDRIDFLALEQKREVTIPIARKILDSLKEGNVQRANNNSLDSSLLGGS